MAESSVDSAKVKIVTLGCAKNEVDSEEIAGVLQGAGFQVDASGRKSDVTIINTCGFLEASKEESIKAIKEAVREKHAGRTGRVIVAGCLAQRLGSELMKLAPGADSYVGVGQMGRFDQIVRDTLTRREQVLDVAPPHHRWADVPTRARAGRPWSAYLKVSEGCDHKCTFCTIPSFRGKHESKPIERVLAEAKHLARQGTREINLIAQDVTQYGYDLYREFTLPKLLRELNEVDGIDWIRILYFYPNRLTNEVIETMATLPKVAKYIDIPLQHVHADTLRRMKRPWEGARYLKTFEKVRAAMPDVTIRTTFIVGFPGETDDEFRALLDFVQEAKLDRVGAFVFSREPGTPSYDMEGQVSARVKRERYDQLMRSQQKVSLAVNQRWVGKELRVLVEDQREGWLIGRSHRDAPEIDGLVIFRGDAKPGDMVDVQISEAEPYDLIGAQAGSEAPSSKNDGLANGRTGKAALENLVMLEHFQAILREDQILSGPSAERGYDCDAYTVDRSRPSLVVLPESTHQVAEIVRLCNRLNVPFTARGAGTGLSGGALPALGGVVISTKRMTQILETDLENRVMKAQVGIANKRLTDAVRHAGLHFAPDPSSQTVSTLGGNIAENAGGPHTLKYGVTVQHVLGVTIVEPGGDVVEFGGPNGWGPDPDFVGVICGSEGTLGIVTEAWVKLTPLPKVTHTALAAFGTIRQATETVAAIIASGTIPAALEMMDEGILKAVSAAFGVTAPSGTQALLLIECDGENDTVVEAEMASVRAVCERFETLEIRFAADEAERAKLWTARKKGVGAMGRLAPTVVTHDGVIPRSKLPEMLDFVYDVARRHQIGVANIFHAGDGNLHPCFYFDDRDPRQIAAVVEAGEDIIRKCIELGGSVTGEHGIGVEKVDLMPLMFTPEDLEAQSLVREVFNSTTLCNPCKLLPNQRSCAEHKMRWRGAAT